MQRIKNILFKQNKSSLNLFLVLPILLFFLLGCLCSDSGFPKDSCITADGKTIALTTRLNKLRILNLSDGKEVANNSENYVSVLCTQDNDIVSFKTENIRVENKEQIQKTAIWKNSGKTKQVAQIDFLQEYIGIIQDKYLISSSREYVEDSKTSRPGGTRTFYKIYTKPQIFTLEDLSTGKLTNYSITPDKLGIDPLLKETYFRFYPLTLSADNNLLFAVDTQFDSPRLYKLDMLSGKITKISENKIIVNDIPPKKLEIVTDRDFNAVSDKTGKFVAFIYSMDNGKGGLKKIIRVFNLETNREIISKTITDLSFSAGGVKLFFEENSKKLAMLVYGYNINKSNSVWDITVFDLQNGNEITTIDMAELFKAPEMVGLYNLSGDELIVSYSNQNLNLQKKNYLCKVNIQNKQIVWETDLD